MSNRINRLKQIAVMLAHIDSLNNAVIAGIDSAETKAMLDLIEATREYDVLHRTTLIGEPRTKEDDLTIGDMMKQNLESKEIIIKKEE
jgi:hypothetical protein